MFLRLKVVEGGEDYLIKVFGVFGGSIGDIISAVIVVALMEFFVWSHTQATHYIN